MQTVKFSSILGTKTFQNIFSTWLTIRDGNKRCFNLLFLKIYMAYLLFPSNLFNGLMPNYFKEVASIPATSLQFIWIQKLYKDDWNRLQTVQSFALLLPLFPSLPHPPFPLNSSPVLASHPLCHCIAAFLKCFSSLK